MALLMFLKNEPQNSGESTENVSSMLTTWENVPSKGKAKLPDQQPGSQKGRFLFL